MEEPLSPAQTAKRARAPFGHWFAIAASAMVMTGFVLNNLAPYLGLHQFGPMTMYSDLLPDGRNHAVMPRISLVDDFSYVRIVEFGPRRAENTAARDFRLFLEWTRQHDVLLNLNFVRYHLNRVCGSEPDASVKLDLYTDAGQHMQFSNVCGVPSMLRYSLLSSNIECMPDVCTGMLKRWAARKLTV